MSLSFNKQVGEVMRGDLTVTGLLFLSFGQREGEAPEDQKKQNNHKTTELCKVISWVRKLCCLNPLPLQAQKIRSYKVARYFPQDHQSTLSYLLLVWEMAEDISWISMRRLHRPRLV